jgi:antitoxin HicB
MSKKAFDKIAAGLTDALTIARGSSGYDIRLIQLPPEDGGGFLAWVPNLPGCISDGATSAEAIQNATAAIDEWIAEAIRLGRVVPAPTAYLNQAAH